MQGLLRQGTLRGRGMHGCDAAWKWIEKLAGSTFLPSSSSCRSALPSLLPVSVCLPRRESGPEFIREAHHGPAAHVHDHGLPDSLLRQPDELLLLLAQPSHPRRILAPAGRRRREARETPSCHGTRTRWALGIPPSLHSLTHIDLPMLSLSFFLFYLCAAVLVVCSPRADFHGRRRLPVDHADRRAVSRQNAMPARARARGPSSSAGRNNKIELMHLSLNLIDRLCDAGSERKQPGRRATKVKMTKVKMRRGQRLEGERRENGCESRPRPGMRRGETRNTQMHTRIEKRTRVKDGQ